MKYADRRQVSLSRVSMVQEDTRVYEDGHTAPVVMSGASFIRRASSSFMARHSSSVGTMSSPTPAPRMRFLYDFGGADDAMRMSYARV